MINDCKSHFPIFQKYPELVYLDNAATTQRPKQVIEAISNFYSFENANIHRGIYDLSNKATAKYEGARKQVAHFLGTENENTIAFTQGTTGAMNIVAQSFLKNRLKKGDNIVTTIMEHHANFIPWQMLSKEKEAELRIASLSSAGDIDIYHLNSLLDENTQLLTINHISNTLGTINDLKSIIKLAHKKNIPVLVDAAQSAAYYSLDIEELNYDFLTFSGHKIFGPFGIGILYVNPDFIEEMQPYQYGGGIITNVTVEETSFRGYPYNLDAGTPNVAGVVGLSAALEFVESYNKKEARTYLHNLTNYTVSELNKISEISALGNPKNRSGIISFTVNDIHPHDVASFLNKDHIAVRAGMHCTQPLLASLETPVTVRASLAIYNDEKDIDKLIKSLKELINFWS